ncbi:MAG: hypothetical protein R3C14_06710 [Caldilineaceae bacterium]
MAEFGPEEFNPEEFDLDEFGSDELGLGELDLDERYDDFAEGPSSPSLPIIFLSAASAIAGGVITLYVAYRMLLLPIELSAGLATFVASIALGLTGAGLSFLTRSRAATSNIAFSCGLIVLSLLFFGLCTLVGAAAALFLMMISR